MWWTQKLLNGVKLGKPTWTGREAASLIVGIEAVENGAVEYLVTQRSPHSPFYPNGICFPG